jgi:predicted ATP-dependent protease
MKVRRIMKGKQVETINEPTKQKNEISKRDRFLLLMKEKEKVRKIEEEGTEEEEMIEEKREESEEVIQWRKKREARKRLDEYSLRDIRKEKLRKNENITYNDLFQWAWYFIENQKEAPEKLKEE